MLKYTYTAFIYKLLKLNIKFKLIEYVQPRYVSKNVILKNAHVLGECKPHLV